MSNGCGRFRLCIGVPPQFVAKRLWQDADVFQGNHQNTKLLIRKVQNYRSNRRYQ